MLLRTNTSRVRAHVTRIEASGEIVCSYYLPPAINCRKETRFDSTYSEDKTFYSGLKVNDSVDIILVGKYPICIEPLQIHSFDIKTLYPNGLQSCTAIIQGKSDGISGLFAKARVDGIEQIIKITHLTKVFSAQTDIDEANKVKNALKCGDSVNVWLDPSADIDRKFALYMSVNYR